MQVRFSRLRSPQMREAAERGAVGIVLAEASRYVPGLEVAILGEDDSA